MILTIETQLDYGLAGATPAILQIEASAGPGQLIRHARLDLSPYTHLGRVPGADQIGERVMLSMTDRLTAHYTAEIEITRTDEDLSQLDAVPLAELPGECVSNLMSSRYCPADEFQSFTLSEFGTLTGGPLVLAIRDWISQHIAYVPGSSDSGTSAVDTFVQRRGVCRDFAHLLISLTRALGIPSRFASVYAPDVTPQDFHAVAEVYLAGRWHLVDATGMARASEMALIGVGADAAQVAFLTVYGQAFLNAQQVRVSRQGV